jgi:hypothetical protein
MDDIRRFDVGGAAEGGFEDGAQNMSDEPGAAPA